MKRFLCGLLVGLILSFTTPVLADTQVISVFYNGKQIQSDVPPAIIDGRLMVPLRMIGEAMDVQVDWDADKQRVDIVQPIHMWIQTMTQTSIKLRQGENELPAFLVPTVLLFPVPFFSLATHFHRKQAPTATFLALHRPTRFSQTPFVRLYSAHARGSCS